MLRNQKPLSSHQVLLKVIIAVSLQVKPVSIVRRMEFCAGYIRSFSLPFLGAVKVYLKQNMFRFSAEISPESLFCSESSFFSLTLHMTAHIRVKVNRCHYRPKVPGGFQEFKVPRLRDSGPEGW